MNRIWIDVEALFVYAKTGGRLSGIQRLEFELYRALHALPESKNRIFFVRHDRKRQSLTAIPWELVEVLCRFLADGSGKELETSIGAPRIRTAVKAAIRALPPGLRDVALLQVEVLLRLARLARGRLARIANPLKWYWRLWREYARPSGQPTGDPAACVREGDILAIFGAPWIISGYSACLGSVLQEKRLRLALLVYDIIPLRRPEWFKSRIVESFHSWLNVALPLADTILTISAATARDLADYAHHAGLSLRTVPVPIPIGTGFNGTEVRRQPASAIRSSRLPPPDSYALFVSTLEVRKNHILLFHVWRRLLEEMPAEAVPTLVFAGRVGWLVSDLMEQLHNSQFLNGKIIHVESPTDAELEALYDGCLFTLFPSVYEGWGLPVTESHAFGRPCIVSRTTSLPEAGGSLARYIDPENAADAYRMIRATIEDPAGLRQWRDRVRREFRPVEWSESARAVVQALDRESRSETGVSELRWSA